MVRNDKKYGMTKVTQLQTRPNTHFCHSEERRVSHKTERFLVPRTRELCSNWRSNDKENGITKVTQLQTRPNTHFCHSEERRVSEILRSSE